MYGVTHKQLCSCRETSESFAAPRETPTVPWSVFRLPALTKLTGKRGRGDLLTASQQSPPLATVHQKDLCVFRAITSARRGVCHSTRPDG